MGLIKAAATATGSILRDQWKEMYYCDSLGFDTLMVRGTAKTGKGSANRGTDNIITNGSIINVADGQCAIIVDNGEVVEVAAEPGSFTYDNSTEPTIFCGDLGEGVKQSWEKLKKRFTFGGDVAHDQRVYYFNTKEMIGNKFGTPNPIAFRAVDVNIGLDMDTALKISGTYSFKMVDPVSFYKGVAGNVTERFAMSDISDQLKAEFLQALQPAIGKLSELQIRPSAVPSHVGELADYLNENLTTLWGELRGFKVISVALNPVVIPEEDAATIKELQKAATMKDPQMAAANLASAQADAMRMAAQNEAGAMNGFVGMGMAMNAGGTKAQDLFAMGNAQASQAQMQQSVQQDQNITSPAGAKFCSNCGSPLQPGAKFCSNCGAKVG